LAGFPVQRAVQHASADGRMHAAHGHRALTLDGIDQIPWKEFAKFFEEFWLRYSAPGTLVTGAA
jgi:hypothetical protein